MSDSVRPHRQQPTRFPCPWDSPDKNTGVGCHFFLQYMKVKSESEVAQSCPTLSNPVDCSLPGSSVHGIFQARVLEWGAITLLTLPQLYLPMETTVKAPAYDFSHTFCLLTSFGASPCALRPNLQGRLCLLFLRICDGSCCINTHFQVCVSYNT